MFLELPVRVDDLVGYEYPLDIEGQPVVWIFRTRYSFLNRIWYLDILDADTVVQAGDIALVGGVEFLKRWRHANVPPGQLYIEHDPLEQEDPLGVDAFDTGRFRLMYKESDS